MIYFTFIMPLVVITAFVIARIWLLKKITQAGKDGTRPFDDTREDT